MITIGFTGTRNGGTDTQVAKLRELLLGEAGGGSFELHHGDCMGADAQAHAVALELGQPIIIHPGVEARTGKSPTRAYCKGAKLVLAPMTMFARNREIVADTKILIAFPWLSHEQAESGTWHTINEARKARRLIYIIWPDGSVSEEVG